ncbi:hypothetical protein Y032_0087g2029 [Ancylostoma ceylanicum]|uniref:Uncharacterized protein n=1 Tax=Ancylostoma ceylanicum TaxID=53326 RepID=A0A016TPV2_9BILA|nr:hypothetical protein Y032_0087g2029 [Ancylostoma ceylanicum]
MERQMQILSRMEHKMNEKIKADCRLCGRTTRASRRRVGSESSLHTGSTLKLVEGWSTAQRGSVAKTDRPVKEAKEEERGRDPRKAERNDLEGLKLCTLDLCDFSHKGGGCNLIMYHVATLVALIRIGRALLFCRVIVFPA